MAAKPPKPTPKPIVRRPVADTTGMDPEMARTLGGETARVMKQKAIYAPQSLVKPKPKQK